MSPIRSLVMLGALGCVAALVPARAEEPLLPLPVASPSMQQRARIALGRQLFYDARLSHDGKQNCVACHDLARGGADGLARSRGFEGRTTLRNTPSIYNTGFNFRQSWNGAAPSLEVQLGIVIASPNVYASSWPEVIGKLAADADLVARFRTLYGAAPSAPLVADALSEFLRALVTPARFDRYLRGDAGAISADEKKGYALFKGYGCVACHQGVNVGANMFQKIGVMHELPGSADVKADLGRFHVTGRAADKRVFKVPSLRNVALTAPYFHDGSIPTLADAVDAMFRYQLGRSASRRDKELIVKFLHTLNGEQLPPPAALATPGTRP